MNKIYNLLKEYGESNPEKFNEDLIHLKENDDVLSYINSIFKTLEVIKGVEFLESSIETDESKFPDYIRNGKHYVNIMDTRLILINFKFRLTDSEGNSEIVERYLFYPKLIDKTYFVLNGSKHFPIYQIIDSATYNNRSSLTLKTLLMGGVTIIQMPNDVTFKTINDEKLIGKLKIINLFKNKINYLLYYLADRGLFNTLKYFISENYDDYIQIVDEEDYNPKVDTDLNDVCYIYKIHKTGTYVLIEKEYQNKNVSFCINLLSILNGMSLTEIKLAELNNYEHWKIMLGRIFSINRNNYLNKANDILISFKRILDTNTKKFLRLKEENKEDIFALIRWMTREYNRLILRDNMDLKYKRIRIHEYLYYDLLIKMSNKTYSLLNKNDVKLDHMMQLFSTLSPMFIIKKINKNELLRYFNNVNAIELFNPSLKWTFRGYQGLGGSNKDVNEEYRSVHNSYIGRIGLISASSGDPGMSGTFTPFFKNYGFYFSDEMLD